MNINKCIQATQKTLMGVYTYLQNKQRIFELPY